MPRKKEAAGTGMVALTAVLGGLALLMLYAACVIPTGTWGWTAVAGLAPMAAVASLGIKSGFLCWGGVSLLAVILLPDKFCALLFTLLFGLYPMIKALAERGKNILSRCVWKLIFFNVVLTMLLAVMRAWLFAALPEIFAQYVWLLYGLGNIIFVIYDIGLTRLIRFYLARIDRAVRKSGRFG